MEAPPEWLLSRVCEEFHCTPDEAKGLDADEVLTIIDLRQYRYAKEAVEAPDSNDETLAKAAVSASLVDAVMANIERKVREGRR